VFSTRLSWSLAQIKLAAQVSKSLYCINKLNFKYNFPFKTSCEIFDKCTLPILTYGSEIWDTEVHTAIENVHLNFCRNQIGVGSKTAHPAILGECGRYNLYIECLTKCIKYWLKLIALPENCLLKACYNMLFTQCNQGRANWASRIKLILQQHGFGYVWELQNPGDGKAFIIEFKERLKDCDVQMWRAKMEEMSKLQVYRLFKIDFNVEPYLSLNIPKPVYCLFS